MHDLPVGSFFGVTVTVETFVTGLVTVFGAGPL